MLVVDDGSPDRHGRPRRAGRREIGGVNVLRRSAKSGLGSAYRAGFKWGLERGFEALVEMDCDFSHDPAALPALVAPLDEGTDLSVGSRYVPGGEIPNWSFGRRFISRGGNIYADVLLGLKVKDSTSGFRAYRAEILRKIDLDGCAGRGVRVPDRDGPPGARARRAGGGGADPLRRPGGGPLQDVHLDRRRGVRPRHMVGIATGGRAPRCGSGGGSSCVT